MRTMSGGPCLHFDCANRNSFGYCRTTVCINENYRHEEWTRTSDRTEPVIVKPQTNADRIRQMSDEELAEWATTVGRTFGEEYEGYMSALDWLKSPVEVDDGD